MQMGLKIIAELRQEKGLSKSELARLSGVARGKIAHMETTGDGKWVDAQAVLKILGYEIKFQLS